MIQTQPIVDAIRGEFGSIYSTEQHGDDDIIRNINSAVRYVWNYRDWSFSKDEQVIVYTTPLQKVDIEYVTPVYAVSNGDNLDLPIYDKEGWFKLKNKDGAIACYEDKFVAPVSGTYTILYRPVSPRITSFDGFINLPDRFEDVVKNCAIAFGYADEKQYDKRIQIMGEVKDMLNSIADRVTNNAPSQIIIMGQNTISNQNR